MTTNCKYLTDWLCCMKRADDDPICIEVEGIECKYKEAEDE